MDTQTSNVFAAFLSLAVAEGCATELTKAKYDRGYRSEKSYLRRALRKSLKRAFSLTNSSTIMLPDGVNNWIPANPTLCEPHSWVENGITYRIPVGSIDTCGECGQYLKTVTADRKRRNRRVKPGFPW